MFSRVLNMPLIPFHRFIKRRVKTEISLFMFVVELVIKKGKQKFQKTLFQTETD